MGGHLGAQGSLVLGCSVSRPTDQRALPHSSEAWEPTLGIPAGTGTPGPAAPSLPLIVRVWRDKWRTGQGRGSGTPCLPPVLWDLSPQLPTSSRPLCWCQRQSDSLAWPMLGPGPPFHLPLSPSSSLVPREEFWANKVKESHGVAPYLPHGATGARPFPSFPSPFRPAHSLVKGVNPPRKQMEPSLTFSLHLSSGMGQTTFFGLAPSPLTWGPASPSSSGEGRGFLAAKRVPPATPLPLFPSSSLESLPLNPKKFMAAAG